MVWTHTPTPNYEDHHQHVRILDSISIMHFFVRFPFASVVRRYHNLYILYILFPLLRSLVSTSSARPAFQDKLLEEVRMAL